MTLQEAYQAWVDLFPEKNEGVREHQNGVNKQIYKLPRNYNGDCCEKGLRHHEHRMIDGSEHYVAKPDSRVCPRERAWRKYISIRDNVNHCIE